MKISDNKSKESKVQSALDLGNWISIIITLLASYFLIKWMLPSKMSMMFFGEGYRIVSSINVFGAGGIRDKNDILLISKIGASGWLCSTAIHLNLIGRF